MDFILHEFMTDFGLMSAMDADSLDDSGKLTEGWYYLLDSSQTEEISDISFLHEGVLNFTDADYEKYVRAEKYLDRLKEANGRDKPGFDPKVILSQNMLFCKTLIKMGEISGKDFYTEQATALLNKLRHFNMDSDRLFRINYAGDVMPHATIEDYAFTIDTLLSFFHVTKEKRFLKEAASFTKTALRLFCEEGVIYMDEDRTVTDTFDDSMPSGASLFAEILMTSADVMGTEYDSKIMDFASDRLIKYAGGHPTLFAAFKRKYNK